MNSLAWHHPYGALVRYSLVPMELSAPIHPRRGNSYLVEPAFGVRGSHQDRDKSDPEYFRSQADVECLRFGCVVRPCSRTIWIEYVGIISEDLLQRLAYGNLCQSQLGRELHRNWLDYCDCACKQRIQGSSEIKLEYSTSLISSILLPGAPGPMPPRRSYYSLHFSSLDQRRDWNNDHRWRDGGNLGWIETRATQLVINCNDDDRGGYRYHVSA